MPGVNRIGGDWSADALEAFRTAYAQQLTTPENLETDSVTGLPTNTVSNTSPWISHTGLWRYPSGRGPDQDLKQPFDPNNYLSDEIVDDSVEETEEDDLDHLVEEIVEPEQG